MVSALCAFLLGVCYEFDREPGEITRYELVVCIVKAVTDEVKEQPFTLSSTVSVLRHLLGEFLGSETMSDSRQWDQILLFYPMPFRLIFNLP